jgi:integrase
VPSRDHLSGDRYQASADFYVDGRRVTVSERFAGIEDARDRQRELRQMAQLGHRLPPRVARKDAPSVSGWWPRTKDWYGGAWGKNTTGNRDTQFESGIQPYFGNRTMAELQHRPENLKDWREYLARHGKDYPGPEQWQAYLRDTSPDRQPPCSGDGRCRGGLGPSTIRGFTELFARMFKLAASFEDETGVYKNPFDSELAKPAEPQRNRAPRKRKMGWTSPKIGAVYHDPDIGQYRAWVRYRAMIVISAACGGQRVSELGGLTPEDLHRDRGLITISATLGGTPGSSRVPFHFKPGKGEAALRGVPVPLWIFGLIDQYMAEVARPAVVTLPFEKLSDYKKPIETWETQPRRLIFTRPTGLPLYEQTVNSVLGPALTRAGLMPERPIPIGADRHTLAGSFRYYPPTTFGLHLHALRAWYISVLLRGGVPLPVVKKLAGHSIASATLGLPARQAGRDITLDTYASHLPGDWDEAAGDYEIAEEDTALVRAILDAELGPFFPEFAGPRKTRISHASFRAAAG